MAYKINEPQFQAVTALTSQDRMKHFIGKAVDWQVLWGVRNHEGWLTPKAPEGFEYFPLWPHPLYAERATAKTFPGNTPTEFSLRDFTDELLPMLNADGVKVAIFPGMDWTFWVMEPADLRDTLTAEWSARYA